MASYDYNPLKAKIKETEEWLAKELSGVRTGRATPTLLDGVKPEAYGVRTPLTQLASVSIEDARTLRIIPWDATLSKVIEKGITDADLGVGVGADDHGLRVTFPELSAERRTQLSKIAKERHEQAKNTLRSHRADELKAIEEFKKGGGVSDDEGKRFKDEVQKLIDAGTGNLDKVLEKKEAEIAQ